MENVNEEENVCCDEKVSSSSLKVPFLCRSVSLSFAGGDLTSKINHIKESKPFVVTDTNKCTQTSNKSQNSCDSSNGFKNTIAVLEKQIKQRRLWFKEQDDPQEDPTALELQLMALERLKSLSETTRLAWFLMNYIIFTDINNASKREQKHENIEKLARNLKNDTNDCLYHIAREKGGLLYLKVVKSPQKERGNFFFTLQNQIIIN